MNSNKQGKLVLYSGASGVGKGTLLSLLKQWNPDIWVSVSNTTRQPREGEIDGVHYNFVTREAFERVIDEGGYLEYAPYCDNYYGTPLQPIRDKLAQGRKVFLEIEVKGALQVMEQYPDILSIFVVPPSMEELERRLRGRGTEEEDVIRKRLEQAREEMQYKDRYRHVVVNDEAERAAKEIQAIINQ